MMTAEIGHNGFIEPSDWAWECAQSKAHAYIKLIVHTLRCLVRSGEQEASISDARLAELTSLEIKTVKKYRKMAHDNGWAKHTPGQGRGKASRYQIGIPTRTLFELNAKLENQKSTRETGTFKNTPLEGKGTAERVPLEGKGTAERVPFREAVQKKFPPHPPKENNYINNNHHSRETATARGGGQDLPGLSGSTSVVIEKLAGWIRPGMPDYSTARASLENLVGIYPPEIVRDSFAHLETKMLSGDIVPSPLKYFMATCRGMNSEAEKERQKDKKPPGMSEKIWKRIQEDEAKAKANGGISLW